VNVVESDLLRKLGNREITKAQLFKKAGADLSLVPHLLEGTASPKATVRYGCASALVDLTEKHPDRLYPYLDSFFGLLEGKNRILTWNAMAAIANLTAVDCDHKFDKMFDRYYSFLGNEYMVTVANVVVNSAKIVSNKPYLADRICTELLKVQNLKTTPHLTEECKLVIAQHAIKTFNTLINYTKNKQAPIEFARKHQNSSRASLKKEACKFLQTNRFV
jgi:hypothetical protein